MGRQSVSPHGMAPFAMGCGDESIDHGRNEKGGEEERDGQHKRSNSTAFFSASSPVSS